MDGNEMYCVDHAGNGGVCFLGYSGTLTSKRAQFLAYRAFGHSDGVTVTDPRDGTTYRCTAARARQVDPLPREEYTRAVKILV